MDRELRRWQRQVQRRIRAARRRFDLMDAVIFGFIAACIFVGCALAGGLVWLVLKLAQSV